MGKTLQEILDLCQEKDIQIVDFKMTDIDGRWRHLSIPVGRLNEETMQYGIGFDGSNYGYAPVESSDMVFVPDLDSATVDPFAEVPTLTMIGDVMIIDRPANRPFDQYPRNVAKRAIGYMQELGIADEMIVGPEYEFYIFDQVSYTCQLLHLRTAGRMEHGKQRISGPQKRGISHQPSHGCHTGPAKPYLSPNGGVGCEGQIPSPGSGRLRPNGD